METTTVAKQAYVAPVIVAGFSGTLSSPDFARRAPAVTIRMPGIGLRARVIPERVIRRKMTLPANVGAVGWLRKSAGIGDKIGTTVIGGHVSDRHDNPGALFRLSRAHTGQQIAVARGGTPRQFKVVSKKTFDRRHKLPQRYFVTTGRPPPGAHQLHQQGRLPQQALPLHPLHRGRRQRNPPPQVISAGGAP